jgi:hypothetical protein
MPEVLDKVIYADGRGRVTLGPNASNKAFKMSRSANGELVLTPVIHVPEQEAWFWRNPQAQAAVAAGLTDAAAGRINDIGSFAQFAEIEID